MKKAYYFLILFLLAAGFYIFLPIKIVFADTLVIKKDGGISLVEGFYTKDLQNLFFSKNAIRKAVLGSSSGVTVTVDVSPFLPTDTPSPTPSFTPTPTPTSTPTPTTSPGSPTNTPAPTNTPTSTPTLTITPVPSDSLLATISSDNGTTTESVDQVVVEGDGGNSPIVISSNGDSVTISQGENVVETNLPVQINNQDQKLKIEKDKGEFVKIITPDEAIKNLVKQGTFLIPSTIKTYLVKDNNKVTYKIKGLVNFHVINFFYVKLPSTYYLDGATGEMIKIEDSLIIKILTFLHLGKKVIK